jgi:hypothetical protein
MTSSHSAAEKARNTATSSGMYSHVQVIALPPSTAPDGPASD